MRLFDRVWDACNVADRVERIERERADALERFSEEHRAARQALVRAAGYEEGRRDGAPCFVHPASPDRPRSLEEAANEVMQALTMFRVDPAAEESTEISASGEAVG